MEIIFEIEQLPQIAKTLVTKLTNCKIVTFTGPLGAGKTTMVKELLYLFGVKEDVVSPTFTYMNIYKNNGGKTFIHFDLYRVKTVEDFLMAGFDEYLIVPNSLCLIEWPEVIDSLLKPKGSEVCNVSIDYYSDNKRIIRF